MNTHKNSPGKFATVLIAACTVLTARGADQRLLNLSLEEIGALKVDSVSVASRTVEKVTDVPSSVSVLTRDQIQKLGYRTLAEALRGMRSFDVTTDRAYTYTGVRGVNRLTDYGSQTLIMVDGHRMNEPIYDSASTGMEALLDVDEIERVEVVRGPGSAIYYGSNAAAVVVNVITRRGNDVGGTEVSGTFGTLDAQTGRLTYGKRFSNGLELLLSGSAHASGGNSRLYYREYDTPGNNHGIADHRDTERDHRFFGSASYGDFTLRGGFVSRSKDVPTGAFDMVFTEPTDTRDDRGFLDLSYTHTTDEGWHILGRAFYDTYDYSSRGEALYDGDTHFTRNNDSVRNRSIGFEGGINRSFLNGFRFSMGVDYRRILAYRQRNYDEPNTRNDDLAGDSTNYGGYIDASYDAAKWVTLIAGVRYDHYTAFGGTWNPRFGLLFRPAERTTLKLLHGNAFRAPNLVEQAYESVTPGMLPQSQLGPESIESTEFTVEQYFSKNWRASASVYQNEFTDLIGGYDTPAGRINRNYRSIMARGAELEIEGKWDSGMLVRGSYTYQRAENGDDGLRLPNSPENMVKLQIIAPIWGDKLSLGIEGLYASERIRYDRGHTDAMWLLNTTLYSREIVPHMEISASVYNVLNSRYGHAVGNEHKQTEIEQDGRTFQLKLNYKF